MREVIGTVLAWWERAGLARVDILTPGGHKRTLTFRTEALGPIYVGCQIVHVYSRIPLPSALAACED